MLPTLFEQGTGFVTAMVQRVRANLNHALAQFAACPALSTQAPDGGYYLFPAVPGWDDDEELVLYLLEKGVLVHPGFFYGEPPGSHIMLSALTEPAPFEQGIARLCAALR
jgi:aspartate/methionine/tyrosine aminotransferase